MSVAENEIIIKNDDLKDVIISLIFATVITGLSYVIGFMFHWIDHVSWLEAFGTFTGYSCTYLCVKQSEWNYLIGLFCVVVLAVVFWQTNLLSSAILQIYLIPVMLVGWLHWGNDKEKVPVVRMSISWNMTAHVVGTLITYFILWYITNSLGASMAPFDSAILVLSILAQYTMQAKKLESWMIWVAVNVISIYTYLESGLFVLGLQYILFIATDLSGLYSWRKSYLTKEKI